MKSAQLTKKIISSKLVMVILAMATGNYCLSESLKGVDSLRRELSLTKNNEKKVDLLIAISMAYFDNNSDVSLKNAEEALALA